MKAIAIILARGGSKRIPNKNVIDFNGRPMIAWTIEAAIKSKKFERVLVSTESPEIAELAIGWGAEAPFLRCDAFDDYSTSSEASIVALNQAESFWGCEFDVVAQLMANCPLRGTLEVNDGMQVFYEKNRVAQISCFKYGFMNPWWAASIDKDSLPTYLFPEKRLLRSQDLNEIYCPTGAIWISRAVALKSYKTFYQPKHHLHPMDWISAMDIDTVDDLNMANICFRLKNPIF